jgi:hypothetical protein
MALIVTAISHIHYLVERVGAKHKAYVEGTAELVPIMRIGGFPSPLFSFR